MNPNCLLIIPAKFYFPRVQPHRFKYHILSLMSNIVDIANVKIMDLELLIGNPSTDHEIGLFRKKMEMFFRLQKFRPDVIGISCYTSYEYLCSIEILKFCKKFYPHAITVVGGNHPTALPEDFILDSIHVDYIVRGEGEIALKKIIMESRRNDYKVIKGTALDLKQETSLRFDLYNHQTNNITLSFSRGCPFRCSFCIQSDDFSTDCRSNGLEVIKDKLKQATMSGQVNRIMINDPLFGINKSLTNNLLEILKKEYPNVSFSAETRVDYINGELLDKLAELNFELYIGLESLAADTLSLMNKSKNPSKYVDSFYNSIDLCQEKKVRIIYGLIMNFPGERYNSYRETFSHLRNIIRHRDQLNFNIVPLGYKLLPGNAIYKSRFKLQEERGFLYSNDGWWRIKEEGMRERVFQCLASEEIYSKFGFNPSFWKDDWKKLKTKFLVKYSSNVYMQLVASVVPDIIKKYFKDNNANKEDARFHDQTEFLTAYYLKIKSIYYLYVSWLAINLSDKKDFLLEVFISLSREYGCSLLELYEKHMDLNEVDKVIDEHTHILQQEYEYNTSKINMEKIKIRFFGKEIFSFEKNRVFVD